MISRTTIVVPSSAGASRSLRPSSESYNWLLVLTHCSIALRARSAQNAVSTMVFTSTFGTGVRNAVRMNPSNGIGPCSLSVEVSTLDPDDATTLDTTSATRHTWPGRTTLRTRRQDRSVERYSVRVRAEAGAMPSKRTEIGLQRWKRSDLVRACCRSLGLL